MALQWDLMCTKWVKHLIKAITGTMFDYMIQAFEVQSHNKKNYLTDTRYLLRMLWSI